MTRECKITGKKTRRGYSYTIRGIAKKKKGIGLKITGKTKRRFKPNLKKKRIWDPETKRYVRMVVSAAALRTMTKKGVSATLRKAHSTS